jgi:hypothetical protein
VVSLGNGNYSACWIEAYDMVYYYFGNPTVLHYYGSNVQSCSINRGAGNSNNGYVAWSQKPSSTQQNKSMKFNNGAIVSGSTQTLNTSGKYVQVGNGENSDLSNMYVSSFYNYEYIWYYSQDFKS